jgi:hypothetical protein
MAEQFTETCRQASTLGEYNVEENITSNSDRNGLYYHLYILLYTLNKQNFRMSQLTDYLVYVLLSFVGLSDPIAPASAPETVVARRERESWLGIRVAVYEKVLVYSRG